MSGGIQIRRGGHTVSAEEGALCCSFTRRNVANTLPSLPHGLSFLTGLETLIALLHSSWQLQGLLKLLPALEERNWNNLLCVVSLAGDKRQK